MKFPSIKNLAQSAGNTIKRYPLETLFALTGTIAATVKIELDRLNLNTENWCMRIIMVANLGFLLCLSATLYAQSKNWGAGKKAGIKIAAAIIAASIIFILDPPNREADYVRFFLLSLAFHLMVSFAAFTGKGHIQGFWQFNKTLFLRILASMLYGVVLFAGLSAAIGATNFLFNFKFEYDTYFILWVWITGMFTTIFFLAGVPIDTKALDEDESYPKGLKIFTQYVLIPLSTVYVFILLAYEIKILIEWKLPKGTVSNLILGYAVFGILSLLLVYPIREQTENKWLKTYARSFYFLLIPLQGLLFVAVGTRVFSYGVTEFRYFLIVLAVWLLGISLYFLLFKKQNIKLIPMSLAVLTLLSIYGPQSAFTTSMYSQRRMVVSFFKKHNAFKNGYLVPVDSTKISKLQGGQAVDRLSYFVDKYDLVALQPYFKRNLQLVADSIAGKKDAEGDLTYYRSGLRDAKYEWAKKTLGLNRFEKYYAYGDTTGHGEAIDNEYFLYQKNNITVVKDYDFMLSTDQSADSVINNYNGMKIMQTHIDQKVFILKVNDESFQFEPIQIVNKLVADTVKMKAFGRKENSQLYATQTYDVPAYLMQITKESPRYKVSLLFDEITFKRKLKGKLELLAVSGQYLVKVK
ncbi:DUF4153 domain-containing protein [Mucilaginibacter celer]|uniref:DUF4153 domain-containing protein n=1 Tax=Mucilaginibacter celer TaxID=2305508 RepID=A0A494W5I4_9SPHI|nr:DUF4153 domain-containing protein [Mucilaginibacter celer]AYL98562.1 DUF4153 domain-containing protein [Mucilaginibacter celer]